MDEPVTLQPLPEDDLKLDEEDLRGAGLTAEEIAACPEIGARAGNEMQSGADYVAELRRAAPRYSW
jgi:hypothetical protein